MNLADLTTMPTPKGPAAPAGDSPLPTLGDVVARISAEVAMPLTAALDRVLALASSGRIDRPGLQALREEIADARRVGLRGQQIARFANGEVRQNLERLDLASLLRSVLDEQARLSPGTALGGRAVLGAAEVVGDASLVHAVLQAAADWSAAHACAGVQWQLDVNPWPAYARVQCRISHRQADLVSADAAGAAAPNAETPRIGALDSLDWLLLQYTAHIAGVSVRRLDGAAHSTLVLAFTRTVNVTLEGVSAVDLTAPDPAAPSMAGCQVLVLAASRDTRQVLREALQGQDLLVDWVATVSAAVQYCEDGAPQFLLYETAFAGDALQALKHRLAQGVSRVALLEIVPGGQLCDLGAGTPDSVTRLGSEGLRPLLQAVMTLELARARQR